MNLCMGGVRGECAWADTTWVSVHLRPHPVHLGRVRDARATASCGHFIVSDTCCSHQDSCAALGPDLFCMHARLFRHHRPRLVLHLTPLRPSGHAHCERSQAGDSRSSLCVPLLMAKTCNTTGPSRACACQASMWAG
jgi:hypothetical protein